MVRGGARAGAFGRADLLREFCAPYVDLSLGVVGLEDCGGLSTDCRSKKTLTEEYFAHHFCGIQVASGYGGTDTFYRFLGTGDPADGLTKVCSGMAPFFCMPESDLFSPGMLRPLRGLTSVVDAGARLTRFRFSSFSFGLTSRPSFHVVPYC